VAEESEEELTDDETFEKRHALFEQDEIKRYNVGLTNKKVSLKSSSSKLSQDQNT